MYWTNSLFNKLAPFCWRKVIFPTRLLKIINFKFAFILFRIPNKWHFLLHFWVLAISVVLYKGVARFIKIAFPYPLVFWILSQSAIIKVLDDATNLKGSSQSNINICVWTLGHIWSYGVVFKFVTAFCTNSDTKITQWDTRIILHK